MHNASIFSLYLPVANVADVKRAMDGRNYTDTEFYHTLLMSNHMESDPGNSRTASAARCCGTTSTACRSMYQTAATRWQSRPDVPGRLRPVEVQVRPTKAPAPFHNNTCDGCHVRNGSGVPINTEDKLDAALREFMTDEKYVPYANDGVEGLHVHRA